MRYARVLAVAGATALSATTSLAADRGPIIYPPIVPPPVVESFSNWYLRGDIGMTNQRVGKLDNVLFAGTQNLVIHDLNFESGMLFGLGAGGFRVPRSRLRADRSKPWRMRSNRRSTQTHTRCPDASSPAGRSIERARPDRARCGNARSAMQANCAPRAECGAASRAGVTVMVPAFVLTGDKIKVSTDSGEYMERG